MGDVKVVDVHLIKQVVQARQIVIKLQNVR